MNHSIGFRERRILRLESDWFIVYWAPIAVIKLWWTWTYLPTQWPWASSHVCSFREQQEEFHHDNTKAHLRWPVISSVSAVLDKTLALHQHGPPPKGLPASREWLPAPVSNPWDKNFTPKEAPTSVKVLVNLPKRWEPVDTSPLMLNPPKVTAVHQVPDSEISRFAVWLEAFSTRAAHSAALSATMLEASYRTWWSLNTYVSQHQVGYDARRGDTNYGSLSTTNELRCHGSTTDVAWHYSCSGGALCQPPSVWLEASSEISDQPVPER